MGTDADVIGDGRLFAIAFRSEHHLSPHVLAHTRKIRRSDGGLRHTGCQQRYDKPHLFHGKSFNQSVAPWHYRAYCPCE